MLLLPFADPLGYAEFGGQEIEMDAVHKYRRATDDLKAKGKSRRTVDDEDEHPPVRPDDRPRRPGKGGGGKGEAGNA